MRRPDPSEHPEYYSRYIDLVPDGNIVETLTTQMKETQSLLDAVPADREEYGYAPGKWSVREVVGHLIDAERLFAFRCVWMARGASGEQPSMDQEEWAAASNAARRPLAELAAEWAAARQDHIHLFRGLDDEGWGRIGAASGNPFTARCFPWIIAGHELYHRALLRRDYGIGGGA